MKNKKNVLLIIAITLIILVIGGEVYYFVTHEPDDLIDIKSPIKEKKDNSKYLVDISTPYYIGGLTQYTSESGNAYYRQIDGLKDENIEASINKKIEEEAKRLGEKYPEATIFAEISQTFSNILSVAFNKIDENEDNKIKSFKENDEFTYFYSGDLESSLNFDLTTGNEIKLNDIYTNEEDFIDTIIPILYKENSQTIGYLCTAEMSYCREEYEPDYSKVEDNILSIVNSIKNDKVYFVLTPHDIYIEVNDVYVYSPTVDIKYSTDGDPLVCEGSGKTHIKNEFSESCLDVENYEKSYVLSVRPYDIRNILTIYDKFATEENIFTNDRTKMPAKFITGYRENRELKETDNYLYDYQITAYINDKDAEEKIKKKAMESAIKEIVKEESYFNYYNINGEIDRLQDKDLYYISYKVKNLKFKKEDYLLNKTKIYEDLLETYSSDYYDKYFDEMLDNGEFIYPFLKENKNTKNMFYYYILDAEGNKVDQKELLPNNFKDYIPNEWLGLGNYKDLDEMIDEMNIIINSDRTYKDNLVLRIDGYPREVTLEYKDNVIKLNSNMFTNLMF